MNSDKWFGIIGGLIVLALLAPLLLVIGALVAVSTEEFIDRRLPTTKPGCRRKLLIASRAGVRAFRSMCSKEYATFARLRKEIELAEKRQIRTSDGKHPN
jgi:hypothetical protein